ncbi:MAG: GDSL-type esterase/lipase family protein [Sandaracinus sp.]
MSPRTSRRVHARTGAARARGVGGALVVAAVLPYLVPGLERFRVWLPDEPVPVVRLYAPSEDEVEVAEPIDGTDPLTAALEAPVIPPPTTTTSGEGADETPRVRIDPSELQGLVREIEDPSGHAMDAFYAQLERTALSSIEGSGEEGVVTRIAHFGDSTIALDGITMTTRESLQLRFGDAGHGFVLAARGLLPYRHFQVRHETDGNWRMYDLTHAGLSDGHYGLGGVQVRSASGGTSWFASDDDEESRVGRTVGSFQILFQRHARGGELQYRVDEGEWETLDTEGAALEDAVHRIDVPDGEHRLSLRTAGHGETRLYGVVLERSGPGVVYDSLGIVGARASRMLGFDPAHLRTELAQRETNLVVIAFGGNDADDNRSEDDFFETFRQVAHLVREARPEASCLLFAPLDQAERDERGRVVTLAPVPRIVSASRRAAEAEGCAFFDTWTAMGGEGAMGRWFRRSPRLSSGDFRHATPAGYRVIGNLFYRALLAGFAQYLAREDASAAPGDGVPAD